MKQRKTFLRQQWQRLKSEASQIGRFFNPYLQKLAQFLWHNKLYILWFAVYDYITIQIGWLYQYVVYYEDIRRYRDMFRYGDTISYRSMGFIHSPAFVVTLFFFVSIGIALLFGDTILRTIQGIRPIETEEEKEYLAPLFEEICQDIKETFPEMRKTKLYIIDHQSVNAQAIGKKSIAITQGAIHTFSRDELKAIIAHEMGHIYYGNSMAILLNTIGNGIFSILVMVFRLILLALDFLQAPFEQKTKGLIHLLLDLVAWIVTSLEFMFLFVGNILLMGNSRSAEYSADKFAYMAGYSRELKEALYMLQKMSLTDQLKIVERMQASHPRISRRIMKIEQLLAQE